MTNENDIPDADAEVIRLRALICEYMEAHWTFEDKKARCGYNVNWMPPEFSTRVRKAWEALEQEAAEHSEFIAAREQRRNEQAARMAGHR